MEITNQSLDWDTEDMVLWRQFLETRAGRRLLPKVTESVPLLLDGGEINKILIRNGEVRGFQQALGALLSLANPPALPDKDQNPAYPPLDDDEAWGDGQKLNSSLTPAAPPAKE